MITMLLGVNTLLLAVILAVLVHHIPKKEWIAIVDKSLILCWRVLIVLFPFSTAVITILWEVRHHQELSFFVNTIPFFFLCLSFAPFAILTRNEHTLKKALALAAKWIAVAFGLMLFALWDPQLLPSPAQEKVKSWFTPSWPFGDIIAWGTVLLFGFFSRRLMRQERFEQTHCQKGQGT